MAEVIRMPRMSDTMEEGVIVKWHVKVGDKVESGDLLAEIETDKATMEFESFQEGTILYIGVAEGEAVPVEAVLAVIGEAGEDYQAALAEARATEPVKAEKAAESGDEPAAKEETTAASPAPAPAPAGQRIKASPLARKLAAEKGIDLNRINGSGDQGRIIKRDVEQFEPATQPATQPAAPVYRPVPSGKESWQDVPVSQMRKTIARRLAESKFGAPHYYLSMDICMDRVMEARQQINENAEVRISVNDFLVKAAALALLRHPAVNSSWLGDAIRYNHHVHIGIAVAVEEGLIVPVIRFADQKTLTQISSEALDLAQRARDRKLDPEEYSGNTFSISNLGMFDIDEFTAIINPPDACIMAVGKIREVPALEDGQLVNRHMMKVTLSCDHRLVDGVTGARFLQTFKSMLEEPVTMLA